MKKFLELGLGLCLAAGAGFGLTMYRGQLMDAACYNQNQSKTGEKVWVQCAPTNTTTSFAIHTNGRVRMLDDRGNTKAEAALQQNLLKSDKNGDMPVTVAGWRHGNTIRVSYIQGHKSNASVH